MPQYRKGDMFDASGVHVVTGNACLSKDGTLVMGLGAALAFKKKYPDAPKIFGTMVREYCGHLGRYGLLLNGNKGILQTRQEMHGRIDPDLIKYGLSILRAVAEGKREKTFHLIYPGMSLNRMSLPEIDRVMKELPDNICIWQRS